ncbi:MAG TPA: cytochrome c oxidase subunit II [Polyangiaceae bacterium]|nr:cytochrome c oxidase subunit II [Polyangiaceae bacterium]
MVRVPLTGSETPFAPVSPFAAAIAHAFDVTLVVCAVLGLAVAGAIGYSLVAFRARAGAADPPQIAGHRALEVVWTVVPLAIVTGLFVMTVATMAKSDPPAERAPDLTVVAHQWWWEVRYASGAITANEIHVPVGASLLVRLESADVVHDFSVPQLTRKMDAVPGHPNHFWLRADAAGAYGGACFEFCGAQHAWMRLLVLADPLQAFDAWQAAQRAPARPPVEAAAVRGESLFRAEACGSCHAVIGRSFVGSVAPDLTHVASRTTLAAGVLDDTPDGLRAWLRDPQAVKPGSHMPSFNLSEAQVSDLASYLEGLR